LRAPCQAFNQVFQPRWPWPGRTILSIRTRTLQIGEFQFHAGRSCARSVSRRMPE